MCTKEGLACLFLLLLLLHNRRHAGKPNLFRPILLLSPRLRTDDDEVHLLDRPPPPTALNGRAKTLKKGEKLFQAASFLIPAARLLFLRLIPSPSPAPFPKLLAIDPVKDNSWGLPSSLLFSLSFFSLFFAPGVDSNGFSPWPRKGEKEKTARNSRRRKNRREARGNARAAILHGRRGRQRSIKSITISSPHPPCKGEEGIVTAYVSLSLSLFRYPPLPFSIRPRPPARRRRNNTNAVMSGKRRRPPRKWTLGVKQEASEGGRGGTRAHNKNRGKEREKRR